MSPEQQELGEALANQLSSFVNSNPHSIKVAVDRLLRDHPTIQQSVMRFFMAFVEGMAEKTHGIDDRNEASHALAKQIVKIERRHLPYI